jgi:hypothetical protein
MRASESSGVCRCKSCFSRSGERHITTRAISCARAEHRVSIEHQRTLPKHASEREQRRVSVQKLTQPQWRASHPHEGDQLRKSRASSKHRAPAYAAQACERARTAACVDAKADAAAAASVTPPRGRSAYKLALMLTSRSICTCIASSTMQMAQQRVLMLGLAGSCLCEPYVDL